jgi:hypothetical protein
MFARDLESSPVVKRAAIIECCGHGLPGRINRRSLNRKFRHGLLHRLKPTQRLAKLNPRIHMFERQFECRFQRPGRLRDQGKGPKRGQIGSTWCTRQRCADQADSIEWLPGKRMACGDLARLHFDKPEFTAIDKDDAAAVSPIAKLAIGPCQSDRA